MMNALVTIIHVMSVVLDGSKGIVPRFYEAPYRFKHLRNLIEH